MSDLLLTLGHNASAVAVQVHPDGTATVQNAYELERLSGVKSDSRFPFDAMVALKERGVTGFDRVFVTHWDPMNQVGGMKSKYWDPSVFPAKVPIITQEMRGLTHHDCHALAALAFAGEDFPTRDTGILVIDGFGNFAEHLSYYRLDGRRPVLVRRFFGYGTSLGLMYQYATAFLGMKMHEDEYKLLGYGARIGEIDLDRKAIDEIVMEETKTLLRRMRSGGVARSGPDLANLPAVQNEWAARFEDVMERAGLIGHASTGHEARCVIGYVVQGVLENVVRNLFMADLQKPTNLIMTGGVAFNVELNRVLLGIVPGKLCVMPLAGDQGNSLGLWSDCNRRIRLDFGDLCWGRRNFEFTGDAPDGLVVFDTDGDDVHRMIGETLRDVGFVNVVRGRMEYGPRALCNTTTLARADDPAIVAEINRINGRDSVMPFAPVVWYSDVANVFPDYGRLHRSGEFMVCALDYEPTFGARSLGAALRTAKGHVTGRPQSYRPKYEGDSVGRIVQEHCVLINTSFNVHGVPICCDMKDVIHSHQYQHALNSNVRTIVITDQEQA